MDSDFSSPISTSSYNIDGKFKPPKSKISELLPSNILDEIECAHKNEAQSTKNVLHNETFSIQENEETKSTNSSNQQLNTVIHLNEVFLGNNNGYTFKPPRRNINSSINVLNNNYYNGGMANTNQYNMVGKVSNMFQYMNLNGNNNTNMINTRTTFNKPKRSMKSDNFIVGNVLKNNMFNNNTNINNTNTLDNNSTNIINSNNTQPYYIYNNNLHNNSTKYLSEINPQQPYSNMFLYNQQNHLYPSNSCNNNIYQQNYLTNTSNANALLQQQQQQRSIQSKTPPLTEPQIDAIISQLHAKYVQTSLTTDITASSSQSQPFIPLVNLLDTIGPSLFLKLIRTNKGSRYFQRSLSLQAPTPSDIDLLLHSLTQNIELIMCDYYGNYFLQKFLPYLSLKHRLLLYRYIKPNFLLIAHDICGNHTLQSLILLQSSKDEEQYIKECIENHLETLCYGSNSSHVIQKVLKSIKEPDREYINTYIISNLIDLCLNPNGICVVKEYIDTTESDFYMRAIVSIFEIETHKLTFDQFGNFGIQEVIKVFGDSYCKRIIHKITEHILEFSLSKFSSNVVDFVIEYLSKHNKNKFIDVLNKIFFEDDNLKEMLKSKFATYVIENCLVILDTLSENDAQISEIKTNVIMLLSSIQAIKDKKKISKLVQALIDKEKLMLNNH